MIQHLLSSLEHQDAVDGNGDKQTMTICTAIELEMKKIALKMVMNSATNNWRMAMATSKFYLLVFLYKKDTFELKHAHLTSKKSFVTSLYLYSRKCLKSYVFTFVTNRSKLEIFAQKITNLFLLKYYCTLRYVLHTSDPASIMHDSEIY